MLFVTGSDKRFRRAIAIPAAVDLPVPETPQWIAATGGSGQITASWQPVLYLAGEGDLPITDNPITTYELRWGPDAASVNNGGTPTGSSSLNNTSRTVSGIATGTYQVAVIAHNAAGASNASFPRPVTVT